MSDPDVRSEPRSPEPAGGLRLLTFYSLMTGLCPLIPVPFVDDWVRDLLRRRLAAELVSQHRLVRQGGIALDDDDIRVLACGYRPASVGGCLRGCFAFAFVKPLVKVVLKLVQKVFRKILVFLMIKDSVDTFSETFHETYLLRHALALGTLDGLPAPAAEVRRAIEAAVAEQDHRPIEQTVRRTFRSSWRVIRQGARRLAGLSRALRRESGRGDDGSLPDKLDLAEEEEVLAGVVDELTEELEKEPGYFRRLETLFEKNLQTEGPLSISK